jgi:hypothetical protein
MARSRRVPDGYECGPSSGVGVGVGVEGGVGAGVKMGCATVGMITVGQGLAPTPLTVVAPPGKGVLPGEFAAAASPSGVGTGFGLVATVGVIVELQGWVDNPPTPEGLVVPVTLCPAEAPWLGAAPEGD